MNIAEILRNKKFGTKLYSPAFGEITLESVQEDDIISTSKDKDSLYFYNDGRYAVDGECVLFPSKYMRDWSKLTWKKGDVLKKDSTGAKVIFDSWAKDGYTIFYGKYLRIGNENNIEIGKYLYDTEGYSIENKEASKCYIDAIELKFNGKLNMETLEIEPIKYDFKPFDKVVGRTDSKYWRIDFFESYNSDNKYAPYQCMMDAYKECLPYNDKTAKLISTCSDFNK